MEMWRFSLQYFRLEICAPVFTVRFLLSRKLKIYIDGHIKICRCLRAISNSLAPFFRGTYGYAFSVGFKMKLLSICIFFSQPYSEWGFSGLLTDGGGRGAQTAKRPSLPKIFHTDPTMKKIGTVISYLKKIQEYMNHVTHTLSSADISIFSPEISKCCYIKKYRYRLHFET